MYGSMICDKLSGSKLMDENRAHFTNLVYYCDSVPAEKYHPLKNVFSSIKFGNVLFLQKQNIKPGGVAVLPHKSRFIYNLVTKQNSWGKPTYQLLHTSLVAMRNHMRVHNVTKLAMPRIGCGLDGLIWTKVRNLLEEVFSDDPISIVIYNYSPSSV
ncbi:ADP-ribose glycohydrolase OARD1-like [Haematobia irritans]|uniref:ADP-ribose glycohydrolase OARD1-like n=1 Tax=Haematobia irritans TaxID=7368 RepID=UPI003F50BC93